MTQESFQITLTGGEPTLGGPRYAPGERLTGQISLFPEEDVRCRRVFVLLQWRTEGRGTPFSQTVSEITLREGDLIALNPLSFPFSFDLPEQPWSYEGHYIKIVWEVIANVDIPWGRDWVQTVPIVVEPVR
jgi:hypothetical protein